MSAYSKPLPFNKRQFKLIIATILLMIYSLIVAFPFLWMVSNSFRTGGDILLNPYGLPYPFTLKNYIDIFTNPTLSFPRFFMNSTVVTAISILLAMIITSMAAYGFARRRFSFWGRESIYTIIFLTIIFPPQITLLALFQLMVQYNLYNSLTGLVLVYTASALPMNIYILRAFFKRIPVELEEAGLIDGATDWQLFWKVMFPIARPAVFTLIILNFVNFWNEFLYAVTFTADPQLRTLPLAVMFFIGEASLDVGLLSASLVISSLPLIIVYLFLSEWFIRGMTAGAVKA